MIRTQIQLPDNLYRKAKAFSVEREISLAEMTRRGLELFFSQYPTHPLPDEQWSFPTAHAGGSKVPLNKLKDLLAEEQTMRGVMRDDQH